VFGRKRIQKQQSKVFLAENGDALEESLSLVSKFLFSKSLMLVQEIEIVDRLKKKIYKQTDLI